MRGFIFRAEPPLPILLRFIFLPNRGHNLENISQKENITLKSNTYVILKKNITSQKRTLL